MSATGTRLPLAQGDVFAKSITLQIDGETHVVGSVRRRKPEVGDIEIMVHRDATIRVPVGAGLFPNEYETLKGGAPGWKFWQIAHRDLGYVVDFYRFDDLNRGSIMLIRTGPAEFSQRFVIALRQFGLKHDGGYVRNHDGTLVPCPDEGTAFGLAGMVWVEAEARA